MLVTIGFGHLTQEINRLLVTFPQRVQISDSAFMDFNFTFDDVISKCVKLAGIKDPIVRQSEAISELGELKYNLSMFDSQLAALTIEHCNILINELVNYYNRNQWYDSDGACPFRYSGYVGTFDIQLSKPDQ